MCDIVNNRSNTGVGVYGGVLFHCFIAFYQVKHPACPAAWMLPIA